MLAGARFVVVTMTTGDSDVEGAVFAAARRHPASSFQRSPLGRTRRPRRSIGPDTRLFAVRPYWGMPARAWIAADPEFWKPNRGQGHQHEAPSRCRLAPDVRVIGWRPGPCARPADLARGVRQRRLRSVFATGSALARDARWRGRGSRSRCPELDVFKWIAVARAGSAVRLQGAAEERPLPTQEYSTKHQRRSCSSSVDAGSSCAWRQDLPGPWPPTRRVPLTREAVQGRLDLSDARLEQATVRCAWCAQQGGADSSRHEGTLRTGHRLTAIWRPVVVSDRGDEPLWLCRSPPNPRLSTEAGCRALTIGPAVDLVLLARLLNTCTSLATRRVRGSSTSRLSRFMFLLLVPAAAGAQVTTDVVRRSGLRGEWGWRSGRPRSCLQRGPSDVGATDCAPRRPVQGGALRLAGTREIGWPLGSLCATRGSAIGPGYTGHQPGDADRSLRGFDHRYRLRHRLSRPALLDSCSRRPG